MLDEIDEAFLRSDFDAAEGSFLLQLRCQGRWDDERLTKLLEVMAHCTKLYADADSLPRWIASGFWYMSVFVPEQAQHQSFQSSHSPAFLRERCGDIEHVVFGFFTGEV